MLNKQEQEEYNMEKIIVNPEEIRGYGNILKPTVLDDYENITSKLISGGEIEINNVLMKGYNMHPVLIEIECSKSSCFKNETISFNITVYDVENPSSAVTQNVKLYCDDILVQSKTTVPVIHNNHESAYVSFNFNTSECAVGEHIFYCEYKNIRSHKIKLIVKNPVGSITLSSNKSEAYLDENVFWTAIVKDIDGRPVVNEEVTFFNTNGYEWKRITNSNGKATMMTTTHLPSAYGYAIIIIKAKMGNKISNPVEVKFWKHQVQTVTLTADNQIVAFNNNNPTSAVLTATVFDSDGDVMSNQEVTFMKNNVVVGTATTNNDGVAEYTYTAVGAGDVSFKAKIENKTSSACLIEDYVVYDTANVDKSSNYPIISPGASTLSISHDSSGYKLVNSAINTNGCAVQFHDGILDSFIFELDYIGDNYTQGDGGYNAVIFAYDVLFGNNSSDNITSGTFSTQKVVGYVSHGADFRLLNKGILSKNVWYTLRIIREKETRRIYAAIINKSTDDIVLEKEEYDSIADLRYFLFMARYTRSTQHIKNIKIKKVGDL